MNINDYFSNKKSEVDVGDKKELIEKLTEYEIEFDIEEYSDFQEI